MARHLSKRAREGDTLYRVVVEQSHPEWGESTSVYGPYATRGAASAQKTRLTPARWGGWTKKVYIETTAVEWQREEEG